MKLRTEPDRETPPLKLIKDSIKFSETPLSPGQSPNLYDFSNGLSLDCLYALDDPKTHRLVVFTHQRSSNVAGRRSNEFVATRLAIDSQTGEIRFTNQERSIDLSKVQIFPVIEAKTMKQHKQIGSIQSLLHRMTRCVFSLRRR